MARDIKALREHFDNADLTAEITAATLDERVLDEPMVAISVRMPASTLNAARRLADAQGVKVTALLRGWIEDGVGGEVLGDDDAVVLVRDLRRLMASSVAHVPACARSTEVAETLVEGEPC